MRLLVASALAATLTGVIGCASDRSSSKRQSATASSPAAQEAKMRCDARGRRVVKIDLNKDDQPDVWKLYETKVEDGSKVDVLTCKERDLNFDGRKDIWYFYDDRGGLNTEEMDLDFDGRIDLVSRRSKGKIYRQEMDTNYDGRVDVWKHFEEEILVRIERDSDYNGKVDLWEYYEDGALDRIGYDNDGDGRVDRWDRAPARQQRSG